MTFDREAEVEACLRAEVVEAESDRDSTTERQRRMLFQLCQEAGLDRDDRLDLAGVVVGRDVDSFLELSDVELGRVLDAVHGWHYVTVLRHQ